MQRWQPDGGAVRTGALRRFSLAALTALMRRAPTRLHLALALMRRAPVLMRRAPALARGASRPALAAPALMLATALSAPALAQTAPPPAPPAPAGDEVPLSSWRAPASCPDHDAVASRLRDTLGSELAHFGRDWQVHGEVQPAGESQWRLLLELREPGQSSAAGARRRVFHARHCEDLVEAAAVAVALALGDAREAASTTSASSSAGAGTAPSTAVALAAADGAASDGAASGGAVEDDAAASEAHRVGAALPRSLNAALEAVLDTASAGNAALGGSLALGGWLGPVGLEAHGLWLPARDKTIAPGQRAEFSLLAAGGRLCYRAWGSPHELAVALCGGMEAGRFNAESRGLVEGSSARDSWLAPSFGLHARAELLGHLAARSRLELLAPLRRQTYRVDRIEPIHEIPTVTVRWSLGLEADLPLP